MELVRTAPPALTSLQRWLLGITSLAVAATRVWARSATLWDWDEALFCLGVRDYDVTQHHPHPPGFPLYVAIAKVLRLVTQSDFHALQAIVVVSAIALFPLLFWLGRELRLPFRTAFCGSLLFVFLPNVWFYGGTAFSDVPALAITIAACAALLEGCRSRRAYFAGALLLGLACAIRPQALLFGCAPALVASWSRIAEKRWRDVVAASVAGIAVIAVSYGGAALASQSAGAYLTANRNLRDYMRHVDSFLNPARQPLLSLFGDYFVREVPGGRSAVVIGALALVSVVIAAVRRDARVWMLVAIFLPFNVFAWLMLDTNSISRYAVSYTPMYALLAADALSFVPLLEVVVVLAIAARLAWWTLPALREVRHSPSPPVAAVRWIRTNVPRTAKLYVHGSMAPWTSYLLRDYNTTPIDSPAALPLRPLAANDWLFIEGATSDIAGHNFVRDRGRLFDMVRQRYFEVSFAPASGMWQFGRGWYDFESVGDDSWRWMGGRSATLLPPLAGNGRLELVFDLPGELVPRHTTLTMFLNGVVVDRFTVSTPSMKKSWIVPARGDRWNELAIALDRVINPAKEHISGDARDLGLRLTGYSWAAAR